MMKHAKLFNTVNDIAKSHAEELLRKFGGTLQKGFDGNTRILDVGCGDGAVTEILTTHLPSAQWSACDISSDMIKFAERTYGELGVEFFEMDIRNEVKEELKAEFDLVFCLLVLHRIHNQRLSLSNIYSLLKPNGRCLVSIISDNKMFDIDRRMAKDHKWSPYIENVEQLISPYHRVENPEESLKTVMLDCGFRDVVVSSKHITWPYTDIRKYKNLVKSVDPCLSEIPLELHEEYVDEYFEILADDVNKSPPYYYRLSVLEALAYK